MLSENGALKNSGFVIPSWAEVQFRQEETRGGVVGMNSASWKFFSAVHKFCTITYSLRQARKQGIKPCAIRGEDQPETRSHKQQARKKEREIVVW